MSVPRKIRAQMCDGAGRHDIVTLIIEDGAAQLHCSHPLVTGGDAILVTLLERGREVTSLEWGATARRNTVVASLEESRDFRTVFEALRARPVAERGIRFKIIHEMPTEQFPCPPDGQAAIYVFNSF